MQILHKEHPFSYSSKAQISVLKHSFSDAKTEHIPQLESSYSTRWKAIIPPLERLLSSGWKSSYHPLISIHTTLNDPGQSPQVPTWRWSSRPTYPAQKIPRPDKLLYLSGRGIGSCLIRGIRGKPSEQPAWLLLHSPPHHSLPRGQYRSSPYQPPSHSEPT